MTYPRHLSALVAALAVDDAGQDLVEYSLLAALVGLGSIAAWQQLRGVIAGAYGAVTGAGGSVQGLSACTPGPGGSGC